MALNPWQVESIQAFYYIKCPECKFDTKEESNFEDHAIENHPLSYELFGKKSVKEEEFDFVSIKEEQMSDCDETENNSEQFDFHYTEMVDDSDLPEIGEVKKELIDEHFGGEDHIIPDFDEKETNCDQIETVDKKDLPGFIDVKNWSILGVSKDNASDAGNGNSANGDIDNRKNSNKKPHEYYSKAVLKVLKEWLHKHLNNPYPSDAEKLHLANKTGLTVLQVNKWFYNARRRDVKSLVDKSKHAKAVRIVLKEWLHKHLTNPYPSDGEKLNLANKTGLTVPQVHNWFINARRRKFKSLIDESKQASEPKNELVDEQFESEAKRSRKTIKSFGKNKPFSCHLCQKRFLNGLNLKNHILSVHEGKNPYKCPYCNGRFSRKDNIIGFTRKDNLKKHIESFHEGKKSKKTQEENQIVTLENDLPGIGEVKNEFIEKQFQSEELNNILKK